MAASTSCRNPSKHHSHRPFPARCPRTENTTPLRTIPFWQSCRTATSRAALEAPSYPMPYGPPAKASLKAALMAEASGLLNGKRGLVMGVANNRSIAWGIAKACHDAGAELAFTYQGDALK